MEVFLFHCCPQSSSVLRDFGPNPLLGEIQWDHARMCLTLCGSPAVERVKFLPVNWVQLERTHYGQSPGTCVHADLPSLRDMYDWTESSTLRTRLFSRTLLFNSPCALPGPSCHPLSAFQLVKMGVSHLCWGRRSLFSRLCSHPGRTSQNEL